MHGMFLNALTTSGKYLNPKEFVAALVLFLAHEPPLQTNGTVQVVLDLQVGRDQVHFGGATLPVYLGSA